MISLVPGLKDISENIKARGIVERFLEHSRFMIFCNEGDEECFITSADLMPRNIDRRIEVTCPVFDKNLKNELRKLFQIQWNDTVKARIIDPGLSNKLANSSKQQIQAQVEAYNYLKEIHTKQ